MKHDSIVRSAGASAVVAVGACCLIAFLDGVDSQAIAIAAPLIARDLSLGSGQLGLLFSIGLLGAAFGAVSCGPAADRWGPKRVLTLCVLCFGIFTFATGYAGTYSALLMARAMAGFGLGGATPCFLALAADHVSPGRRARLLGLLWACFPVGGFVGGFANGWIQLRWSWHAVFVVGGVLPLIAALLILAFVRESPLFLRRVADAAAIEGQPSALSQSVTGMLRDPRLRTNMLLLWCVFFGAFGMLAGAVVWMPSIMVGAGFSPSQGALVLSCHAVGALISMASAGYLVERLGPRLLTIGLVGGAAAFAATGLLLSSLGGVVAGMVLAGVFLGFAASGGVALAGIIFPPEVRSSGLGWSMGWGRFGQVVLPFAMGLGLSQASSGPGVIVASALLPLGAAVAATVLVRRLRRG